MAQAQARLRDTVLAGAFVLAWSSGFIAGTLGTRIASGVTVLMWRFVIAAPVLLAWSRRRPAQRLSRRGISVQLGIGLLSQSVYLAGNVLALKLGVPAGTAALVCAAQPIVTAAFAGPVLGEMVTRRQSLGLIIAAAGVWLVVAGDLGAARHVPFWAYGLPVAAMAGLVAGTLLQGRARTSASPSQSLAIQSAGSTVVFIALALATHTEAPPSSSSFWIAAAWFAALTGVGYGLYWANMARTGATRISSLIALTPPATAIWAAAMFGQPLSLGTVIGMGVSLAGVLLATGSSRRREEKHEPRLPGRRSIASASPGIGDVHDQLAGVGAGEQVDQGGWCAVQPLTEVLARSELAASQE
jgi:drug/metabolite transporter (DMT)-like permease